MSHLGRGCRAAVAVGIWCLLVASARAQVQAPPAAWATLKEHFVAVERLYETQDGNLSQLTEIMRHAGPSFQRDRDGLLSLRNTLALGHRTHAYQLWAAQGGGVIGDTLSMAQRDFAEIDRMQARFLDLANQMRDRRTPQSESEFRQYLAAFSQRLAQLDDIRFQPVYNELSAFAAECPLHADVVARFSDPVGRAIDTFYADPRYAGARNEYQAKRRSLFAVFAGWDAQQQRTAEASQVVRNDWRRIHEDTVRLVAFLRSPDFVNAIPDIDAATVIDSVHRIGGYLQTYR